MNNGIQAVQVFGTELAYIKDSAIREFVVNVFSKFCPDHFWERPTSTTGFNHPEKMNKTPGGLANHTKYVVWWVRNLLRTCDSATGNIDDAPHHDVAIAAALLHDVMKDGDPARASEPERQIKAGHKLIVGCHGVDLANAILRVMFNGDKTSVGRTYELILSGVAGHMGVWTIPAEFRPQNIEDSELQAVAQLVHLADYCAAQKVDAYLAKM